MEKWKRTRKLGKFWYVLLNALTFSLLVSLGMSLSNYLIDKFAYGEETSVFRPRFLLLNFLILFTTWLFFSIYIWNKTEKEYLAKSS
jgi:hypothetical protein